MRAIATLACWLSLATPALASLGFAPGMTGGRALYLDEITRAARQAGVPPALADAVAMIETGYRADAFGSSGEIGLMQVMPATAASLGFRGSIAALFDPVTNIGLGVRYLARAWAMSGGDVCRALMKYRAGLAEEVMTPLSQRYCARARYWLAGIGSPLSGGIGLPADAPPAAPVGDPYVIAIVPALAAQARLAPVLATAHELMGRYHARRSMADRDAALRARFDSHQRRE
jgi:soluble lytic murein transglycosylase-like protein